MKVTKIIEQIEEDKKNLEFMETGFPTLDKHLDGGFMKKELIVLGGMTGIGKSYMASQVMWNITKKGFKTAYYSLEISNSMIVSRLIGAISNIKSTRIIKGNDLTEYEFKQKHKAIGSLKAREDIMDFNDDLYDFSAIKKSIIDNELEFVVIDFIQNVMVKGMDEYTRLTHVALEFQRMAKQNNCAILVLSQLSNFMSRSNDLSIPEYKGSGAIAMVCDLGFYITREKLDENSQGRMFDLELYLAKNRRGTSGIKFQFDFTREGGLIYEATKHELVQKDVQKV